MALSTILLIVLLVAVMWVISTYNFFVSSKTRIKASIQEIGNQLKRQADLIPNLESSAKGYLKHEKDIYEKLTAARKMVDAAVKSNDIGKMSEAGNSLSNILPKLQVMVESNPELKANTVVTKLMEELRDTADKLMYSRRILIDLSADYNIKRVTMPTNIVAGLFRFEEMKGLETSQDGEHLKVSESDKKSPKISL